MEELQEHARESLEVSLAALDIEAYREKLQIVAEADAEERDGGKRPRNTARPRNRSETL
jgi:hypothetical protein